jgi:hypothetical protein
MGILSLISSLHNNWRTLANFPCLLAKYAT